VMMTYVFIFGSIGIELYLIPGATFATYLLYPSKWKSALFFVYLLLLFVSSKLILLWKFDTPVLNELQGVLYFPNIVLALSLTYLATLMFRSFQEDQRIELNRSNQVKQRLISIISHDLRSPVISLKQLLGYAEKVGLEEDEFKDYLKRLTTSVQYTSEMIDKVLFWANNQMKGIEVEKKNFDIGQLVEEELDVAQESAKQKEVKLNFHRNGELTVDADPEMLRLVLSNVVNNAVKFSPKKVGEFPKWKVLPA
jgi:signal transduction histidine kinase